LLIRHLKYSAILSKIHWANIILYITTHLIVFLPIKITNKISTIMTRDSVWCLHLSKDLLLSFTHY